LAAPATQIAFGDLAGVAQPDAVVLSGNEVFLLSGTSEQFSASRFPHRLRASRFGAFLNDRSGHDLQWLCWDWMAA